VALEASLGEPKTAEASKISPPADSGRLVADGDDSWSRRPSLRASEQMSLTLSLAFSDMCSDDGQSGYRARPEGRNKLRQLCLV